MRNLLLLLAALGMTGVANAQSDASTSQSGNSNKAKIEQTGANSGTNALGATAGATIDQSGGNENQAFIRQEGDANYGQIVQVGSLNMAVNGGTPGIGDRGDDNSNDILQQGNSNFARTSAVGDENMLDLDQVGNDNSATFRIRGDRGTATILQDGSDNLIDINGTTTGSNSATLEASSNDFMLTQTGDFNVIQGDIGGMDNSITVSQSAGGNFLGGDAMTRSGDFLVDGDMNTVMVTQGTAGNSAAVSVVGNGNSATITQN